MRDGQRTRGSGPLPLEARRALWQRLWDRLLAPPLAPDREASAPTGGGEAPSAVAPSDRGRG